MPAKRSSARRGAKESLDYHRAFRQLARSNLPTHQYRTLHQQAMATAGGFAAGQARQDRRVGEQAAEGRALRSGSSADAIVKAAFGASAATDSIDDILAAAFTAPVRKAESVTVDMPVLAAGEKQILYCVGLEPDSVDSQGDVMTAAEIEQTAHAFIAKFMAQDADGNPIHAMHTSPINAHPVESFIAPQDLTYENGTFGTQVVKRGSWVLGIHVADKDQWAKVKSGEYTGISVGGYGLRIPYEDDDADDE